MNLKNFDLNLLKVLDALLTTGSTTEAANRVGLSQPAVSAALGRLRHGLGDPLLVRQGRRMVPTDYARDLAGPLSRLLDETEGLLSGPGAFDPWKATETFRISGSDFFSDLLMPKLAEIMAREAPGVVVQLVDLVPDSYVATIDRYQADMALIPKEPVPDWISETRLFGSPFVTIARRDHPRLSGIAPGGVIPLDLFCDLGHVLFSPEGNTAAFGDAALAKVGRSRRVVMTVPFFTGVYTTVSQSDLIALIPCQLAEAKAMASGFEVYQAPMPLPVPEIHMVWHSRADRNPAHSWLRAQISSILSPLDRGLTPQRGIS